MIGPHHDVAGVCSRAKERIMKPLILIVDDDYMTRRLTRDFLERFGFDAAEASDGEECLLLVRQVLPDLILLDILMPLMNGIKTMICLACNPHTKTVPVIAVTGDILPSEEEELRAAGCRRILSKPWKPEVMLATVRGQLSECEAGRSFAGGPTTCAS